MSEEQALAEVRALLSMREKLRQARRGTMPAAPTLLELQAIDRLVQSQQQTINDQQEHLVGIRPRSVVEALERRLAPVAGVH